MVTHASLFSGIGGPEVAAAMLGWENAFHCEINPFGRHVLEYWFPKSVSYEDITKTDFTKWRGRIDVLTGGFPCQPFSYAGKRGGQKDERYLWPEMLRVIDEIRPTWVVGENVAGLSTMVEGWVLSEMGSGSSLFEQEESFHDWLVEQTFTIEKIAKELEGLGYSVQPMLIPAAAVGAPHRRDRIFILAHNDSDTEVRRRYGRVAGCSVNTKQSKSQFGNNRGKESSSDSYLRGIGEIPAPVHSREHDGDILISDGGVRNASDTYGKRLQESQHPGRGKDCEEEGAWMDNRSVRPRRDEDAADTNPEGLSAAVQTGLSGKEERHGAKRPAFNAADDAWAQGTWWDNFPTQSPVHRGNDGLPFPLDDLTISASKWRTESLKAYGNAIVPQVMYRIFQAIEQIYKD